MRIVSLVQRHPMCLEHETEVLTSRAVIALALCHNRFSKALQEIAKLAQSVCHARSSCSQTLLVTLVLLDLSEDAVNVPPDGEPRCSGENERGGEATGVPFDAVACSHGPKHNGIAHAEGHLQARVLRVFRARW